MTTYLYQLKYPAFSGANMGDWQARHCSAVGFPRGSEVGVVELLKGWASYADRHHDQYDSGIGDDGVLGPAWAAIGANIRTLLNGECGRLDCGTLDSFLCRTLEAEGFSPEEL